MIYEVNEYLYLNNITDKINKKYFLLEMNQYEK